MGYTLLIKNMVCDRCIFVITQIFQSLGIEPISVTLGKVETKERPSDEQCSELKRKLTKMGFELLVEQDEQTVSQIKTAILELVHDSTERKRTNLSDYLTSHLCSEYSKLSKLFSEFTNITIEQYYIAQKIEYVKELLSYNELSLSEIADRLYYSSVAHLSAQFKTVTGITPTAWRKGHTHSRLPLDKV